MTATVLLKVYCADCADAGRDPRRLGRILRAESGAVRWYGEDGTWRRRVRPLGVRAAVRDVRVLSDPRMSSVTVPDTLRVFCRDHGAGAVATSLLLTTRASSIRVHIRATA